MRKETGKRLKDVTEQSESNPGRSLGGATERSTPSSSMRAEGKLIIKPQRT